MSHWAVVEIACRVCQGTAGNSSMLSATPPRAVPRAMLTSSHQPLPPRSLNPALPHLKDDEGNDVQFRRTLLNKCQVRS